MNSAMSIVKRSSKSTISHIEDEYASKLKYDAEVKSLVLGEISSV